MDAFRLDGSVALVTGGGSGLGLAIATAMHASGGTVALVGRRPEPLQDAADRLGPGAFAVPADVTSDAAITHVMATVQALAGTVDTLVHCAGTHLKGPFLEVGAQHERRLTGLHVDAGLALARAVVPGMQARGQGCLLFIGSMAAVMGVPQVTAYSAAKGAVTAMSRALAVELGPAGIRSNVITPGWIDTAMSRAALDDDEPRRRRVLARTPLGRLGAAADVGQAAVYLASPAAAFVTGADLVVDGGASISF